MDALERLGKLLGLRFREMFQGGDSYLGMRLQEFGKEEGCRPENRAASLRECFVVATIKNTDSWCKSAQAADGRRCDV